MNGAVLLYGFGALVNCQEIEQDKFLGILDKKGCRQIYRDLISVEVIGDK